MTVQRPLGRQQRRLRACMMGGEGGLDMQRMAGQ